MRAFGKADELPVFISRGAPGDACEIELDDVRKKFAKGKIQRLITRSSQRTEPPCKLFKVGGGCQWQHITYEGQLEHKTSIVKQAITDYRGALTSLYVETRVGAVDPLFYRNKVQFLVRNPQGSNQYSGGLLQTRFARTGQHKALSGAVARTRCHAGDSQRSTGRI